MGGISSVLVAMEAVAAEIVAVEFAAAVELATTIEALE
jgi:hypothetical protein